MAESALGKAKLILAAGMLALLMTGVLMLLAMIADSVLLGWAGMAMPLVASAILLYGMQSLSKTGWIDNPLACPGCDYDLRASAERGVCPECGRAYTHKDVREYWSEMAREAGRPNDRDH